MKSVEIARGFNHHTKERLRIVLGNMFIGVKFGFSAYGGDDVNLIYWMTAELESGKRISKSLESEIGVATRAVIATVKSYC